jgi:hypothetical protein
MTTEEMADKIRRATQLLQEVLDSLPDDNGTFRAVAEDLDDALFYLERHLPENWQ